MLPQPPPSQVSGMGCNSLPQHDIRQLNQHDSGAAGSVATVSGTHESERCLWYVTYNVHSHSASADSTVSGATGSGKSSAPDRVLSKPPKPFPP
jgi:hypothetical protein